MESSPAAATETPVRRSADRRALYRRSNTISSLPLEALQAAATPSGTQQRRQLEPIADSPVRETAAAPTAAEVTPRDERTKQQTAVRTAVPRQGKMSDVGAGKRAQFCRNTSCNDLLLSSSTGGVRSLYSATATSGLVGGSSGRLLTKVKERIRDTVLQTTPEWTVVMQERRQRAAIQFEMQAAKMMADEQRVATVGDKTGSKCGERKSVAADMVERKEAARAAFRRSRSASCEDAITTMLGRRLHPASSVSAGKTGRRERRGSPNSDSSGIICSSKDFQSIIELSQQETATDDTLTSPVNTASHDNTDNADRRSPSPRIVVATAAVDYQKTVPDELSPGRHQRPTGYENTKSLTVEVHVGCSDAAAATSLSEANPVDNDRYLPRPFETNQRDDVPMSSLHDPESATAEEVAADCRASSMTKLPEVVYDADGQTWDIYGAELNPEVLGDAIQRHLQRIMLTSPSKDSDDDDDAAASAATEKREKPTDDCQTETQRNFIRRFLYSVKKRRRSLANQGSSN